MHDRDKMKARVDKRLKQITEWCEKLHRQIDQGVIGGESGREWLDQYAAGEKGLNIACGDFAIGDSQGVDYDDRKIAINFWGLGDCLPHDDGELDYIVTNYLECFDRPLMVLREWYRVLKPGGILAIVARDSDQFEDNKGPMANKNRKTCFTEKTLQFHLERAGFVVRWSSIYTPDKELRVEAKKI